MRYLVILPIVVTLAACGSSRQAAAPVTAAPVAVPFASGPITNACLAADRRKATRRLCGCVQAVANDRLTSSEQSRAVGFFKDPHKAQEARGGSTFWTRYKAFTAQAERTCRRA